MDQPQHATTQPPGRATPRTGPADRDAEAADQATELFKDPRITAVGLMVDTHHGLVSRLNQVFREHNLSGTDFDVLIRLAHAPYQSLRLTDLSSETWMSTSGITRVVDRLEKAGLAQRRACLEDRRAFFVVLTPAGERRLRELVPALTAAIDSCFTGVLTADQLDNLLDALRTLRESVHPGSGDGPEPHGCTP